MNQGENNKDFPGVYQKLQLFIACAGCMCSCVTVGGGDAVVMAPVSEHTEEDLMPGGKTKPCCSDLTQDLFGDLNETPVAESNKAPVTPMIKQCESNKSLPGV